MTQKMQKVLVRGADGAEKALGLVRIEGQTAYVCPMARYREAVDNPAANIEVGVPVADIRYGEAAN